MSATVSLCVPRKDVSYVLGNYYKVRPSVRSTKAFQEDMTKEFNKICEEANKIFGEDWSQEKDDWIDKKDEESIYGLGYFSDRQKHEMEDLWHWTRKNMRTRNKRCLNRTKVLREKFSKYVQHLDQMEALHDYIVFDEIGYRQGWWFKKKFFKSEYPIYYATKKDDAIRLMKKYFDFGNHYYKLLNNDTNPAIEAFDYFCSLLSNLNDDEFWFEIAW